MDSSAHESVTPEGKYDFVILVRHVMAARAHGHTLCSWMQLPEWYKNVDSMHEKVPGFESESEVEVTMRRAVLEVESVPNRYT